ncbi:single-stranded-DNA-specific exonuclease RecJ [Desulfobotulus sp. H1]|uniref:Single-stranded-DNA-specific exonuclease RecJ n=1 Tax=Desulfobotulus pelophilus TaxID=2823377 RepID=A0ABT3N9V4_9BACT|nr:single-stranded-DNA-specific exonuclease RecJ [Desulfobotulus pelophilus]MCW7754215.1 single-stranded-DNA-specific exonuclease RecJ [Desulfobotulus pelophilus]
MTLPPPSFRHTPDGASSKNGLLWHLRSVHDDVIERLVRASGCLPLTATIMAGRGFTGIRSLRDFLYPSIQKLPNPDTLQDLNRASDRIAQAITQRESIVVFGDYDADGITSTALLYGFLSRLNAKTAFHLPHREKEGYGLKASHIPAFTQTGTRLIITVDCGISSHEAIREARKAGIDVVITDHHRPGPELPDAIAVVNPQRIDCPSGLRQMAGVGVAFYLVMAIRKKLRESGFWQHTLPEPSLLPETDLVAIGTIADLVPLTGVNRILVHAGITVIRKNPRPGIQALCRVAGIHSEAIDSESIAFRLAPRINAAGRMAHPELAARLLCAPDLETAMPLALELDRLNTARQNEENRIFIPITDELEKKPSLSNQPALILHSEDWSPGVIGIVASRLVRRYHKPALLIAMKDGYGQASGRSIPGIDLYATLTHCSALLEQYGGHSMAAGFRISHKNLAAFQKHFCSLLHPCHNSIGIPPPIMADALVTLDSLTPLLLSEIEALGPFGMENPAPIFAAKNLEVISCTPMGQQGNHRRLVLRQPTCIRTQKMPAVVFGVNKNSYFPRHLETCLFRIRKEWGQTDSVQIQIEAWC